MNLNLQTIFKLQKEYTKNNSKPNVKNIKNKLRLLKENIQKYSEEIYEAFYKDFHKPKLEVYETEISLVLNEIKWFIKKLNKIHRSKKYYDNLWFIGHKTSSIRKQWGVCLIYSAYNYPFNLSLVPLVGAIAMNNTVLLKLASYNKNVNKVISKILSETFDNKQCFVINELEEVNYEELYNLKVDHVFFTGSEKIGRKIYTNYSKQLIPVVLELGGKSACIVDDNIDIKLTARRIVWAKLLNNGQTCVAIDYLIVHKNIYKQLLDEIIKQFNSMYPIDNNGKDIAYSVNSDIERLSNYCSNRKLVYQRQLNKDQFPFIIIEINKEELNSEVMINEIFGPILPIICFENKQEIIEIINHNDNPLSTYLFTKDKELVKFIFYNINSGSLVHNDAIIHLIKHSPFGGIKSSGLGNYHKWYSVNTFSQLKPLIKSSKIDPNFRYAPYNDKKLKKLTTIDNIFN